MLMHLPQSNQVKLQNQQKPAGSLVNQTQHTNRVPVSGKLLVHYAVVGRSRSATLFLA